MKTILNFLSAFCLLLLMSCNLPVGLPAPAEEEQAAPVEAVGEQPAGQPLPLQAGDPFTLACQPEPLPSVFDLGVNPVPAMEEPAPHQAFRDPVYGLCLVRVTDRAHDLLDNDGSSGMMNEYSRVQAFNADGTLLVVRSSEAYWYLYDARSLQRLGELPITVDPRWDATNPHRIYYTDDTRLMAFNLATATQETIHDFAADFPGEQLTAVWTRYEGSSSIDSRYWGMMVQDENWETMGLLVYDMKEDRLVGKRLLSERASIDTVTISPLGSYLLVYNDEYCEHGQLGSLEHPCGLMVYDRSLETGRGMLRLIGHSDTALDAEGREVLVYQDIDTDAISMLDLASGEITPLAPIDFSSSAIGLHFSGRAFQKPGWALVSTYNGSRPQSRTWMDDTVFIVELKANPRIFRLAHTHSVYDEEIEQDYWAEPHATVNPDFTRVLFTSNWGRSGTGEVEMYMIFLDDFWQVAGVQ